MEEQERNLSTLVAKGHLHLEATLTPGASLLLSLPEVPSSFWLGSPVILLKCSLKLVKNKTPKMLE